MGYFIFAQIDPPAVPVAELLTSARKYFEASIDVLDATHDAAEPERFLSARLELSSSRYGYSARFRLSARASNPDDLVRAREAEQRGRAHGMATLAERCATIWRVDPEEPTHEAATLNLCAVLASVALGPVLPPDTSTLFGVRGAMERVERLLRSS